MDGSGREAGATGCSDHSRTRSGEGPTAQVWPTLPGVKPKSIAALVVGLPAVVLAGAVMLPASAATAAVEVGTIQYHSPGKDNRSNVSLNGEYVAVTNTGSAVADLDRWALRDAAGHIFTFPQYLLQPGDTVYVHTGRGSNGRRDSGHLYWRSGTYIWDDDGDTATLTNASGQTAATCAWTGVGTGVTACGSMAAPAAPTTSLTTAPTMAPTTATFSPPPSLPSDESAPPPTITDPATMTPSPPPSLPPDESAPPPTITESTTVTPPPPAVTSPASTPAPPTLRPDPTDTTDGVAAPPPPLP
jgi:Lamin Tail Domain